MSYYCCMRIGEISLTGVFIKYFSSYAHYIATIPEAENESENWKQHAFGSTTFQARLLTLSHKVLQL